MRDWNAERRSMRVLLAGARVMACWQGGARWEPGEVLSVREEPASCAVLFDANVRAAHDRERGGARTEGARRTVRGHPKLGRGPARRCVQKCTRAGAVCPLDCPYWLWSAEQPPPSTLHPHE